jgi:hypothetical protein
LRHPIAHYLAPSAAIALICALAGATRAQTPEPPADPAEQAAGVLSYSPADFAQFQPASALDMINRIPGFSFSAGDNVRGFQGAVGNVLIDGQRPSSKSVTLDSLLQRIQPDQVVRIDLIRGGAPGIDMQGLPVVANVIRKPTGGLTGAVEFGAKNYPDFGTTPLGKLQLTRKAGPLTLDGSLNLEMGQGDLEAGVGRQYRRNGAGDVASYGDAVVDLQNRLYQASGSAELRLAKDLFHLNLGLERESQPRRETAAMQTPAGARFTDLLVQSQRNDKAEVGGDYERQLGSGVTAQLIGLYTYKVNDLASALTARTTDTLSTRRGEARESILRASVQGFTWRAIGFALGAEGAFNTLDSTSSLVSNGRPVALPSANLRVEEKRAEGFVTLSNRPTRTTSLELGLRVETSTISQSGDADRSRSFTFPKPRLIATWSIDKDTQLRFRAERVVGQLNFQDFAASGDLAQGVAAGNADLQPERAWLFEGVIERRFWDQGAVVFSYTRREMQQVNDRVPIFTAAGVFDAPGNIPSGTRDEYRLNLVLPLDKLGLKRLQVRGQALYRTSKVVDPVTGRTRPIAGMQNWVDTQVSFIYDVPKWRSTFTILHNPLGYHQETYRLTERRIDRRPYGLHLIWSWRVRSDWLLRAQIDNPTAKLIVRDRSTYAPTRAGSLVERDIRRVWLDPIYSLRLRKSF